ncbi:MAG TPA: MOSC domain-containing protein [Thermodesulfovibrionia bacterium]|nr:MOSC domain-containing protein [Thermodesulfovibrionia bacterium]
MKGKIVSVNVSEKKGQRKKAVDHVVLQENYGIVGDGHASETWHRQVSLLAMESIQKMVNLGLKVGPGDFAENITTEGLDLVSLKTGTRLIAGDSVELEITQLGKVCHTRCAIYYQAGNCVMPEEGVFAKVIRGGTLKPGCTIQVMESGL